MFVVIIKEKIGHWLKSKYNILFLFILFFSIFLRLYNYPEAVSMEVDGFRHVKDLWVSWQSHTPLIFSIDIQDAGFKLGPWYYYSLLPFLYFFNFNPKAFDLLELSLFIASLPILYNIVSRLFNKKTALISALLYGTSFIMYGNSMTSWNPDSLPFFVLFFVWSLLNSEMLINNKKTPYWTWVGLSIAYSIAPSFHFSIVPLCAVIFAYILYRFKLFIRQPLLIFIAVIFPILSYLPPLTWDIKNNFSNLKNLLLFLVKPFSFGGQSTEPFLTKIIDASKYTYGFIQFIFTQNIFPNFQYPVWQNLITEILIFLILAGAVILIKNIWHDKSVRFAKIILLSFFVVSVLSIFATHLGYKTRYIYCSIPLYYIFVSIGLGYLIQRKRIILRFFSLLVLIALILINLNSYYEYRQGHQIVLNLLFDTKAHKIIEKSGALISVDDYMQVVDYIYKNYHEKDVQNIIRISAVDSNNGFKENMITNDNFNYILQWRYNMKCDYDPAAQPSFSVVYFKHEYDDQLKNIKQYYQKDCDFIIHNLCVMDLQAKIEKN